ncbi:hypothetical protein HHA04nite_09950 [Halomonas halophila]|uniref:Transglycosylase n=2 Tax=Halomonadaceae TaxID=28256 RepID=A0ABQ0U1N8_9GAMM|nr:hypothetical protein HHA04nite_09950 [Halomonas halophila]
MSAVWQAHPKEVEKETPMSIIAWLIIGGLAGWIAGNIMRGGGFGLLGNIGVGVVGAVVGGFLFSLLGLQAGGFIGSLVTAIVGAVVLLWVIAKVKKA